MKRRRALALVLLAACAGGTAGPSIPTPINGLRAEDRVVIGDFSRVNAIAATTDRVYVVYPGAVAVWQPMERRWEVPRSPPRPDILRGVSRAVVDPLDRTLWLTAGSMSIHYDPVANRWDESPFAVPPARLPRAVPTVEDAMRDLPQLRALAPHIATGPWLNQGTLTAAAPDPLGAGWFLGTSTRGLVFFDRMATDATPIPLGLTGDVVGAIATTADGIWVATDFDGVRPAGLTYLPAELDGASSVIGSPARGLLFNAARWLLAVGDVIWIATDRGVMRAQAAGNRVDQFGITGGLPDERVNALADYRGAIVAGTMRGLARSRGDTGFAVLATGFGEPVYSLLAAGDTLWAGTAIGLFALLPGSDELRMPEGYRRLAGSTSAIVGLGYVADTLVAMTPSQLLWRDPVSGGWTEGPLLSASLGNLFLFAATDRGVWVGGSRGAAFVQPGAGSLRYLLTQDQLPDALTSLAVRGRYLWIGTRAGLVRFLLTN